ncbi:MAG TPA: fibronectin type III domain-containing protein, partial [Verrucomicrobiota bacterium]|nr:fibronectin type III domain-containing protein [Verrucomicrobiota bacterium]
MMARRAQACCNGLAVKLRGDLSVMDRDVVVSRNRGRAVVARLLGVLTIFSGLSASAASVTLAWDPSPDPSVVGYFVYYGDASRSYTTKIDVG